MRDMADKNYRVVGHPLPKKDAMQLLLGKPVYTDDITPPGALVVKLLRSPYAHALVKDINVSAAQKVPGVAAVH